MLISKVTRKGQIVIPAPIRKKLNITESTELLVIEKEGYIILKPLPEDPIVSLKGSLKKGKSALKELIRYRREEAER